MTTIICDRRAGIVIADSFELHNGNTLLRSAIKIVREETSIIGWSGDAEAGRRLLEWITLGEKPETRGDMDNTTCLRLHQTGALDVYAGSFMPIPVHEEFYAIGSGSEFAMAAMYCGKSALEAIRIAAYFNPWTGPPYRQYTLKDADMLVHKE